MSQNITDIFIDNLISFSKRHFSTEDILHAKKCVLDYLGVTLAGAKEYADEERKLLSTKMINGGNSIVIGFSQKVSVPVAALINGISSHAVELDDGQRYGNIHPGSPVVSSLLSVGEANNVSLYDLFVGVLIGYECALRLACAIQPSHKLKGFHATGPCGTIGAAMGIAAMLKFNRQQYKSTFSAACTSACGILEMIEGDTQMMPYNAGKAAMNGVVSAAIGESCFKYPDDALGGKRGFISCFASDVKTDILTDFSGEPFFKTNYFKLYAACGHCHSGIDAALKLRSRHIQLEEIDHIIIETYKLAIQGHDHNIINGVNSAKMSIPYSVAVALINGSAGINDYSEEMIHNPHVLELTSRITVRENEEISKLAPKKRISEVTIYSRKDYYSERVEYPKGQPENPLTMKDIEDKYYSLCCFAGFPENKAKIVADILLNSRCGCLVRDITKELIIETNIL